MLHISDYQKFITLIERQVEIREKDLLIPHHSRDDQMVTIVVADNVMDGFPEYRRILDLASEPVGVSLDILILLRLLFFLLEINLESRLGSYYDSDGAKNAERICHGISGGDTG